MDPIYVRRFVFGGDLTQIGHYKLCLFSGICKNDRLLVQGHLEKIFKMLPVPPVPHFTGHLSLPQKALNKQADAPLSFAAHRRDTVPVCASIQPVFRRRQVSQCSTEADPPGNIPRQPLQPLQQAQHLDAPGVPHKMMYLIDDYIPQISKQLQARTALVDKEALQRFRCNLQYPRGVLNKGIFLYL